MKTDDIEELSDADLTRFGATWLKILEDKRTINRRVETLIFKTSALRERKMSLDLSPKRIRAHFAQAGVNSSIAAVPLVTARKNIIYDFDATVNGATVSIAGSNVDSRIGQAILAALGLEEIGIAPPPAAMQMLLLICSQFPDEGTHAEIISSYGVHEFMRGDNVLFSAMTSDGQDWFKKCAHSPRWERMLSRLSEEYIVTADVDLVKEVHLFKLRCLESVSAETPLFAREVSRPHIGISETLYGAGRAVSEHYRIVAPPGMLFAGGLLYSLHGTVEYVEQPSIDRLVYYIVDAPAGSVTVLGALAPERRDFITPAIVLTSYVFAVLLVGSISQWFTHRLFYLTDHVEALAVISIFIPTGVITYLSKPDDHEVRWNALKRARFQAWSSLLPLALAVGLLIPSVAEKPEGVWKPWFLGAFWSVMCVWSLVLLARMARIAFILARAESEVERLADFRTVIRV